MIRHKDSHVDHVPAEVLAWVLEQCGRFDGFVKTQCFVPGHLPAVECGLYGPDMGDEPVDEAEAMYGRRGGRPYLSRLVCRKKRLTRVLSVIAGPHDGHSCVLYTVFGGPLAPKEVNDPALKDEEREESVQFWSQHALSVES